MKCNTRPGAKRLLARLMASAALVICAATGSLAPAQAAQLSSAPMPAAPVQVDQPLAVAAAPNDGAGSAQRLNPTGRDITLTAPLLEQGFVLGEIGFVLEADDTISVNAPRLLELLQPILSPEAFAQLQAGVTATGNIPAETVAPLGYIIGYDPNSISLTIEVPAAARTTRELALTSPEERLVGDFDEPAGFSGYLNLRGFVDYDWQGPDQGLNGPTVFLDGAFRLHGVVLEGEGRLDFDNDNLFAREGTRLVYDDPDRLVRWTAGDLLPLARGFSGAPQLFGVGVSRLYGVLQPTRNIQPRGDRAFTLARPGSVEVLINGQPVRTIRLQPGTYNLRDFPFVQGTNNVSLLVEDDSGRREVLNFSTFFDRSLLAPGLTEFGLFAGIENPRTGTDRDYQFDNPAANGFIRRGMSETLTLGANFHVQESGGVVGVEGVVATPFGTFGADVAVSNVDGFGFGYAFNVDYRNQWGGIRNQTTVAFSIEHRSDEFATPDMFALNDRFQWDIFGTISRAIGGSQYVSATGEYRIGRDGFEDEYSARVGYSNQLTRRLSLNVEAIYEKSAFFGEEFSVRALLVYRISSRSTATAEVDTRYELGRLGYQTSGGDGVGSWAAAGSVEYVSDDVAVNAAANYNANRAEIGFSHRAGFDISGTQVIDQRTSLRVGTAIAFADGSLALSRPIEDAFVMVRPYHTLNDATVYVQPRGEYYNSRSDIFGPAVEPNLESYTERVVSYDVPEAPAGFDLGSGNVRVYPPYRAGYLVTAGSEYSVTALGTLLDEEGQPVSLRVGQVVELAAPDREPLQVFTNRNGRFGISGLRPGRWRIAVPTEPPSEVTIVVPEGHQGILRLGEVRLGGGQ